MNAVKKINENMSSINMNGMNYNQDDSTFINKSSRELSKESSREESATSASAAIIAFPTTTTTNRNNSFSIHSTRPHSTYPHSTHPHTQQRVSPIRDPQKVNKIYHALLSSGRYGLRNATIFALQLAIGRRTNDIASMKIGDVYDLKKRVVKRVITVDEHKTGKTARDLVINKMTREKLAEYIVTLKIKSPDALLFPSQKKNKDGSQRPLDTASLDNIYQEYTSQCFDIDNGDDRTHISTYAARKTYGYNIYTECIKNYGGVLPGTDINALQYVQSVFNHKDSMTTLRYIGAYDAPASKLVEDIAEQYEF